MTKQQLKKIEITCETKGRLVYATPKSNSVYSHGPWLVIISHIKTDKKNNLLVIRHASYSFLTGIDYVDCDANAQWGLVSHYDFYEPSEEHIELMRKILKKRGYKYVKGINKMFKR